MADEVNKNLKGAEKRIKNADLMNSAGISTQKFRVGTKIWISTDDYTGNFEVTEERVEQGTEFRRIFGGRGEDVVVDLSYLQSELARDNLAFLDDNGKRIDSEGGSGKAV